MSRFREAGARRDTNYFIKHSGIVEVNSSIWEQVASTDQKKTKKAKQRGQEVGLFLLPID